MSIRFQNDGKMKGTSRHGRETKTRDPRDRQSQTRFRRVEEQLPDSPSEGRQQSGLADNRRTPHTVRSEAEAPPDERRKVPTQTGSPLVRASRPVFQPYDMKNGREFYLNAYADTWRIAHGDLTGFRGEDYWDMALYRMARDSRSVLGMYSNGQLTGILAVDPDHGKNEGALWISFAWLKEEMRGKGLGRALFEEAERLAQSRERKELQLCVAESNPAVGFYDTLGFTVCGTEPGVLEPLLKLHKKINVNRSGRYGRD